VIQVRALVSLEGEYGWGQAETTAYLLELVANGYVSRR
jgi:hypothetical protein